MTTATIDSCLTEATARLKSAGIPQPQREARLLLAHTCGAAQAIIIGHPEHLVDERDRFLALVDTRARGVPMAQVLGHREFWSLEFQVTADTLDPRPETETLVEAALAAVAGVQAPLSVLDLGTGTGCLLLALLSELPHAWGIGVDKSPAAVVVARNNARKLALAPRARFLVADWGQALARRFDLVVANPPYIPTGVIGGLQVEVARYEPRMALDGGSDGLESFRAIAPQLKRLLKPAGSAVVEVGHDQWNAVADLLEAAGLAVIRATEDLSGTRRCVICRHRSGH